LEMVPCIHPRLEPGLTEFQALTLSTFCLAASPWMPGVKNLYIKHGDAI